MKVAIIGYGKMGKLIGEICEQRGHEIVAVVDFENQNEIEHLSEKSPDVAIEFTGPEVAFSNITKALKQGVKVVSGSTGWLEKRSEVDELCISTDGTFFYASNFSLGVNLFFKLNKELARLMNQYPDYHASMTEVHHVHKKDSPSGTAITLAEGIIENNDAYSSWTESGTPEDHELKIHAEREGEVPGTHIINYSSPEDSIEIKHEAFGRKGFAIGAVMVAEWLITKKGILSMDDFLDR